jgi:hypothetical protein
MPRLAKEKYHLIDRFKKRYIEESRKLKFKKAINKYVEIVLRKNSLKLDNKDFEEIAKQINKSVNKYKIIRLRRMFEIDEIKQQANNALQSALLKANIDIDTIAILVREAQVLAKSTTDKLKIAEFIKDSLDIKSNNQANTTVKEQINYKQLADNVEESKQVTITKTTTS